MRLCFIREPEDLEHLTIWRTIALYIWDSEWKIACLSQLQSKKGYVARVIVQAGLFNHQKSLPDLALPKEQYDCVLQIAQR